jgi:hypothetical protein
MTELDARIAGYDRNIRELYSNSQTGQRLGKLGGIGQKAAPTRVAAAEDRRSFKNRRQFASSPSDPRRSRRTWTGSRQAGSKKPVVGQDAPARTPQYCRRHDRYKNAGRVELAHQRQRFDANLSARAA